MAEENSDKTGSQPDNKEAKSEVKTDVRPDSSTDKKEDAKSDSSTDKPWSQDPRFREDNEAYKLGKSIKALMDANELDDPDDLVELIESGKKVRGKKVDLDNLDEIAKKAATLDEYETYWKQQDELRKQNEETPEQTIARLKKERDDAVGKQRQKENSERESKEAKQAVQFYESEVKNLISTSDEKLSDDEKAFISWSLGVGNECNEIQITDRKAIKRVIYDGVKKYNNLVKTIKESAIKDYLAGKEGIPKVPGTDGTVATSTPEPPKGLKGLRKAFMEGMGQKG
jgi:hypothetical protein